MPILRRVTSALALLALLAPLGAGIARADVATSNALGRAAGERKDLAVTVGKQLFRTQWPAQVYHVYGTSIGTHAVIGLSIWGDRFHSPLTREAFTGEVLALVAQTFAALPSAEEVDVWSEVPIDVRKDAVVSGDLAVPTTRTVFTVSVRRGEDPQALRARLEHGTGVFWDEAWVASALKKGK